MMHPRDPAALTLVAAENAATLRAELGRANGWAVLRDAVTAIANAQPRQHRAMITDPTVAQRDVTAVLNGLFGATAPHYLIEDHWERDWRAIGFERYATMPIMRCDSSQRPQPSGDLDIAEVTTTEQLGEFERTLVDAFPLVDHRPRRPGALWTPAVLEIEGLTLLPGWHDATPVATACAWVHDGVVGVYWIAVQPHHRRRGYGRAMTAAALAQGAPGLLVATTAGERVYTRVGFRSLATTTCGDCCVT